MIPHVSELPTSLTSLPNWVGWRTETREGSSKPTKVPYILATGQKARTNAATDWSSYPAAGMPAGYDGLGFVFTKEAGFTGIDLDDCMLPDGTAKQWAKDLPAAFRSTYSEISPSGHGVKIWAKATLSGPGRKVFIDRDGHPTAKADADGAIEMYDTGRYFTVTGQAIGPLEIADLQEDVDALYARLQGHKPVGTATVNAPPAPADVEIVTEGNRHSYLLAVAGRLRNEGFDREALLASIRRLNETKCSPTKPDRAVVGIVDFLMGKPAKYRLTPADYTVSAVMDGAGRVVELPQPAEQLVEEPQPDTSNILVYAEDLLAAAIASKSVDLILGAGTEPSDLVLALAQAGSIKQHEAKRRIKDAGLAIPLREFDARIKAAEVSLRRRGSSSYLYNAEGGMVINLANAMVMVQELPLQYNAFTCRSFLASESPWGTAANWTDYDDARATEWCQRQSLNVDIRTVAVAADTVARSRKPNYHPVLEYLKSIRHDGQPRLETWMIRYLGAPDTAYTRAVCRKWLISAVNRVTDPGCQADYTLVLEGPQGKLKSSALRALCVDKSWFSDDVSDVGTKDSAMQLQGKWIVELAELDAFRSAEMTTIKAWLVRPADHFRPPYGRRADD